MTEFSLLNYACDKRKPPAIGKVLSTKQKIAIAMVFAKFFVSAARKHDKPLISAGAEQLSSAIFCYLNGVPEAYSEAVTINKDIALILVMQDYQSTAKLNDEQFKLLYNAIPMLRDHAMVHSETNYNQQSLRSTYLDAPEHLDLNIKSMVHSGYSIGLIQALIKQPLPERYRDNKTLMAVYAYRQANSNSEHLVDEVRVGYAAAGHRSVLPLYMAAYYDYRNMQFDAFDKLCELPLHQLVFPDVLEYGKAIESIDSLKALHKEYSNNCLHLYKRFGDNKQYEINIHSDDDRIRYCQTDMLLRRMAITRLDELAGAMGSQFSKLQTANAVIRVLTLSLDFFDQGSYKGQYAPKYGYGQDYRSPDFIFPTKICTLNMVLPGMVKLLGEYARSCPAGEDLSPFLFDAGRKLPLPTLTLLIKSGALSASQVESLIIGARSEESRNFSHRYAKFRLPFLAEFVATLQATYPSIDLHDEKSGFLYSLEARFYTAELRAFHQLRDEFDAQIKLDTINSAVASASRVSAEHADMSFINSQAKL